MIKFKAKKIRSDGAYELPDLVQRYGRLIVIVLIVIVGIAFVAFHGSPPKPKHCTTEACINPKFSSCTPATFDYSVKSVGSIRYQILARDPSGAGCSVTVAYTNSPHNPSWKNKPMTCTFNNKVPLRQAASDVFSDLLSGKNTYGCTGPLAPIIQSAGTH